MNELHDIYLKDGERVYIGKIDSVHVFPGYERVKLRYWASDPRVKSVIFFWVPQNDSIKVKINQTSSNMPFEIEIGGESGHKSISEGNYSFKIITSNDDGDNSLPFEKIINVYGENYRSTLLNRLLVSKKRLNDDLIVDWRDAELKSLYTEVQYTNTFNDLIIKHISSKATKDTLYNFPVDGSFKHRTAYMPVPESIDVFFTDFIINE